MTAGEWLSRVDRRGFDLIDLMSVARFDQEGPESLRDAERRATVIVAFDTLVVPALLQTPEYALAVMAEEGVRERVERQEVLRGPVVGEFFVHEAALRTWAGEAQVMAEQVDRLARWDHVETRLVPCAAGNRAELRQPFTLLESADGVAVHTENPDRLTERPEVVSRYEAAVKVLRDAALDATASRSAFTRWAAEYSAG